MNQAEKIIHRQICRWLKTQHKDVIFTSEPSGLRLPIGQAKQLKELRSGDKLPDLWILEPVGYHHGMFVELKAGDVINKKGKWVSKHVAEQADTLARLRAKGYYACFGVGFDQTKKRIQAYLNGVAGFTDDIRLRK
jgi:hypothetical protein